MTATASRCSEEYRLWDSYRIKPAGAPRHRRLPPVLLRGRAVLAEHPAPAARPPRALAARGQLRQARRVHELGDANGYDTREPPRGMDKPWYDATGTAVVRHPRRRPQRRRGRHRPRGYIRRARPTDYDIDGDGCISDDERDEDADGLTNFDETRGAATRGLLERLLREGAGVLPSSTPAPTSPTRTPTATASATAPTTRTTTTSRTSWSSAATWHRPQRLGTGICKIDDTLVGPDGPDADTDPDPMTAWHQPTTAG